MIKIDIDTEYITLGQFLKYCNAVGSGAEAKIVIKEGLVLVNNEVDLRRGKKLRDGDIVSFNNEEYIIHCVNS